MHRMITMHARPRQTARRTNIMAIARRFVLTHRALKSNKTSNRINTLAFPVMSKMNMLGGINTQTVQVLTGNLSFVVSV